MPVPQIVAVVRISKVASADARLASQAIAATSRAMLGSVLTR
jgi:hypothetical protein